MKLSKVQITNFRCFESLPISLQGDINVFVGVNGAGKTTILDAIAVALYDVVAANGGSGKRQRANQHVSLRPSDLHVTPGADPIEGRADFVQVTCGAAEYYALPGFPAKTPTGADNLIEWTDHIRYTPPNDFYYETSESKKLSPIYDYFGALWADISQSAAALIPLPVVAYYRADRRLREMPNLGDIFKLTLERDGAFVEALNAGADYQGVCQWFYLRENSELREKHQIRKNPDYEFPDLRAVRHAIKLSIENVESIFFRDSSLAVSLKEPSGGPKVLLLEQLSDGYRNLLAVILDFARRLAQANPHFENPLEAPGILLIDEIELHLHPRWQQTVIPNLRAVFPNTQIIAATHSPLVLEQARLKFVWGRKTLETPGFAWCSGGDKTEPPPKKRSISSEPNLPQNPAPAQAPNPTPARPAAALGRTTLTHDGGNQHPL
jgi:predicted ATP-binding protein involved in virulence